jgi:hypothetical protein
LFGSFCSTLRHSSFGAGSRASSAARYDRNRSHTFRKAADLFLSFEAGMSVNVRAKPFLAAHILVRCIRIDATDLTCDPR